MAIYCKICGQELDVFSGGRCRKCRQLICRKCTASGGATSKEGMLCRNCAATEPPGDVRPRAAGTFRMTLPHLPAWLWIGVPFVLIGALAVVVEWQWWQARSCFQALRAGETAEAAAASEKLGEIGSNYVIQGLRNMVENEPEPGRTRALRTLGKIPVQIAREHLEKWAGASGTPRELRSVIVEALREQERRGWRPPAKTSRNTEEE